MKYGVLFFDSEINRINVSWEGGGYGDGFHAGDVICVKIPANGQWEDYRIEYDHSKEEWFFVGYGPIPVNTEIRGK